MELDSFINYSNALVAPSLAIFGAFIAYQQWITNERKRKQDLFEMRQKYLYSEILKFVKTLPSIAKDIIEKENYDKFDSLTLYAKSRLEYGFLLSSKDCEKLTKLYANIFIEVSKIVNEGKENLEQNIKNYNEKIMKQFEEEIHDIFEKYMRIENSTWLQEILPSIFNVKNKFYNILCKNVF